MITDTSPRSTTYDLIVIGSGPSGQKAALQAAKAGKSVLVIEDFHDVGGGCIHFGTIPSKSFRESVYRYSLGSRGVLGIETAREDGLKGLPTKPSLPDMRRLVRRKDRVVKTESTVIFDQLKRNGVEIVRAKAKFTGTHEVSIGGKTVKGKFFLVGVGARPIAPAHLPVDRVHIFDSNSILELKKIPKRLVVVGGGIIGCEYASMFAMAGSEVYLVDKRPEILASVDREIVENLIVRFLHRGVKLMLGVEVTKLIGAAKGAKAKAASQVKLQLSNGKKVTADAVLIAQGRFGNTDGLGLNEIGIKTDDRGLIKVNANYQTTLPHVYAVGDVIGAPALASTGMEQGRLAACHAFKLQAETSGDANRNFPYGIYTIPEISMIGKTQEELKAEGASFVVGKAFYRELARGQIVGDQWGMLKLLVDRETQKILGVHIIGDNAADLIHIGQAVMTLKGTLDYFVQSVFNYPTLAEAYKTAAFHAMNQLKGFKSHAK